MNAMVPHPALTRRPDHQAELCQTVADWTGRVPAGGAIVEPKVDGIRALWIDGELVTREGSPIGGAEHIEARLRWLEREACVPMFFDGEWQVGGTFDATLRHFRRPEDVAGTLYLFDAMPMAVWRGEEGCQALEARRVALDRMLDGKADAAVQAMPWTWLSDPDDISARAREYIAAGKEGVVVKDPGATYQRRRTSLWQRIKAELTLDLRIVGYEADRERPHLLGVLIVDHKGVKVRVRAGFSDRERLTLLGYGEQLVGAVAEVAAQEVTLAGSLRSPRFVRMRWDKGTVK